MKLPDFGDIIDEIIKSYENRERKYENNGLVDLPEREGGFYSIHPNEKFERESKLKAESLMNSHNGLDVYDSVFKPTGYIITSHTENLSEILKKVDNHKISREMPEYDICEEDVIIILSKMSAYTKSNKLITEDALRRYLPVEAKAETSPNLKKIQEDYKTGLVTLTYFPYSADFSGDGVKATNLYSGKTFVGKKMMTHLDKICGEDPSLDSHNPAELIWYLSDQNLGETTVKVAERLRIMKPESGNLPKDDQEVWLYPYYEVPITSKRAIRKRQKVLYMDKQNPSAFNIKMDIIEYKFRVESSGSAYYSAVHGNEVDRYYAGSHLEKTNGQEGAVKCETKVIRTVDLSQTPPQISIYKPQTYFGEPRPPMKPRLIFWGILGGSVGAIPGLWEGEPWWYLTALIGSGALVIAVNGYAKMVNSNEEKLRDILIVNDAKKGQKSFLDAQKRLTYALEAPIIFFNNYSDAEIWSGSSDYCRESKPPASYYQCPASTIIEPEGDTRRSRTSKPLPKKTASGVQSWLSGEDARERDRKIKEMAEMRKRSAP